MAKLTKQEVATIKARIQVLEGERAELTQDMLTSQEVFKDSGEYGQGSQRDIDTAEHSQYCLKLWDDEYAAELKELKAKVAHLPQKPIMLHTHL
jgi:hypothetical protein